MLNTIIYSKKCISAIILLWMFTLLTSLYLIIVESSDVQIINITAAVNVFGVFVLIWRFTNRGRSFLFLFVSLIILFLGGRLFTPLLGYQYDPGYLSFGGDTYVGNDVHIGYVVLMLTTINALLIGVGFDRITAKKNEGLDQCCDNFIKFLNICILLALPFYLYKNYLYYKILNAQGGYIAMYLSTEHLDEAGIVMRIGALACQALLLARVFFSKERTQYLNWMIFFGIIFSAELIIGLRGKYFVIMLALFFLYITRYNIKLGLSRLFILATIVAFISIAIEQFREQKSESTVVGFILLGFLHQQSISSDVVKGAIAFSNNLGGGVEYFFKQLLVPFLPPTVISSGWSLSGDLSQLVMPQAYLNGFGTGSSYIAELYLIGGASLIFIVNVTIASYLKNIRYGPNFKDFYRFIFLTGLLYYPRSTLGDPFISVIKYGLIFAVFHVIYIILNRSKV